MIKHLLDSAVGRFRRSDEFGELGVAVEPGDVGISGGGFLVPGAVDQNDNPFHLVPTSRSQHELRPIQIKLLRVTIKRLRAACRGSVPMRARTACSSLPRPRPASDKNPGYRAG